MLDEHIDAHRLALILSNLDKYKNRDEARVDLERLRASENQTDQKWNPNFELNELKKNYAIVVNLEPDMVELIQMAYFYPAHHEPIMVYIDDKSEAVSPYNLIANREGLAQYFFRKGEHNKAKLIDVDVEFKVTAEEDREKVETPVERGQRLSDELVRQRLIDPRKAVGIVSDMEGVVRQTLEKIIAKHDKLHKSKSIVPAARHKKS